jgi:hypothetical protein
MQGLDHTLSHSAASRALGGTTFGLVNDAGTLFTNPALLSTLTSLQFSIGGVLNASDLTQDQQYAPLKYYSNFSLLLEGRTGEIPDPDSSRPRLNPGDVVQRPYDRIGPDWTATRNRTFPVEAVLAVPFELGGTIVTVGAGAVRYADMNDFYQNNNVLSPAILSERPIPVQRPPNDSIPTIVQWSQYMRSREGFLQGYGAAVSAYLFGRLSLGASGMLIRGSTDDFEQHLSRGRLTFYQNFFRLDSVYGRIARTGTSEFRGAEFTLSGMYRTPHVIFGFAAKPPVTITRDFAATEVTDTTGAATSARVSGSDRIRLPWRGTFGIAIVPIEKLLLGLEYEIRSFGSASYTSSGGSQTNPWLSSSVFHLGVQYAAFDWLVLRGGLREQAEVFEPAGNPLAGDPVRTSVYSAGVGVNIAGIRVDATYEYTLLKYQDVWGSAVSFNSIRRHEFMANVAYVIPALW